MEEHTAIDSGATTAVGARSQDNRWVIVAIIDPALVAGAAFGLGD